jgi:hypothetical protein
MYEWLERVGFSMDIQKLEQEFGFQGLRLIEWAQQQYLAASPS